MTFAVSKEELSAIQKKLDGALDLLDEVCSASVNTQSLSGETLKALFRARGIASEVLCDMSKFDPEWRNICEQAPDAT